jgi:hypothetical protein
MLNLNGLTTLTGNRNRSRRSRRRGGGLELIGAFNVASQMALLYPPGIDELMRHEIDAAHGIERYEQSSAH